MDKFRLLMSYYYIWLPALMLVVNNLINACTKYPKAETWLHWISDMMAWSTHWDSLGSYKAPLTRSAPPINAVAYKVKTSAPTAIVLFVSAAMALSALSGCATAKSAGSAAWQCTTEAMKSEMAYVLPEVAGLLAGSQPDWEKIKAEEILRGEGVVGCTISKIVALIEHPEPGMALPPNAAELLANGKAYLATKS